VSEAQISHRQSKSAQIALTGKEGRALCKSGLNCTTSYSLFRLKLA